MTTLCEQKVWSTGRPCRSPARYVARPAGSEIKVCGTHRRGYTPDACTPLPEHPRFGAWSAHRYRSRMLRWCDECGHMIAAGETYVRYYGKMAEAYRPYTVQLCEPCDQGWLDRHRAAEAV